MNPSGKDDAYCRAELTAAGWCQQDQPCGVDALTAVDADRGVQRRMGSLAKVLGGRPGLAGGGGRNTFGGVEGKAVATSGVGAVSEFHADAIRPNVSAAPRRPRKTRGAEGFSWALSG